MLTYQKVIELKDNGFPTKSIWFGEDPTGSKFLLGAPSLSELIEACGIKFDSLIKNSEGVWEAEGEDCGEFSFLYFGKGDSPEIAIANLWLDMNDKIYD